MKAGYGRGFYGEGQLESQGSRPSRWFKIALVVGVGAVVWYKWPRRSDIVEVSEVPVPVPQPTLPTSDLTVVAPTQPLTLAQLAEERGYPTTTAYEEAVVESARELQNDGARVVLAPHLQHLTPRLEISAVDGHEAG